MNIQLSSIETLPKTLILEPEAAIHTQALNDAQLACSYVASLRKDVEHLEDQVTYLLNLGPRASTDPTAPSGTWWQLGLTEECRIAIRHASREGGG